MLHKRIAVRRKMEILFMVRINIIKNVFYKIITKGFSIKKKRKDKENIVFLHLYASKTNFSFSFFKEVR
ncbi:hypothetical protein DWZ41_14385 [Bacteroides sp. AF32-15BH]|jgi:hypothetical protein|nr:hypothetical protein DWZ41_14385 [Bacteroides sp. AF32-15BH]